MMKLVMCVRRLSKSFVQPAVCAAPAAGFFILLACTGVSRCAHAQQEAATDTAQLHGKVIDREGKPVAGAKLQGISLRPTNRLDTSGLADGDGNFSVERLSVPVKLCARSADGTLAGTMRVEGNGDVTLRVGPTAEVRGHLI